MNLILGYEMGAALLAKHGDIEACWAHAVAAASQSQGPVLHQNVERIEKGVFPQQLGRLRGHLLGADDSVTVAVVLECGPHVLTLVTGEPFRGIWSVSQQKWYPLKEEEMCGPPLIEQITQLCKDAGNVWVAYFLMANPVAPVAPVAVAPVATKKKTVVRKRVLAEPVVEMVAKKAAPLPNEEGSEINKLE